MTEPTALVSELRAKIIESPADDEARLIYADVLEERGELERAELIRVMIDLTRIERGEPGWLDREADRDVLHRELTIPTTEALGVERIWWDRGMVGGVQLASSEMLERGRELLDAEPIIGLALGEARGRSPDAVRKLAAMPGLDRLAWLSAKSAETPELRALLRSPHLAGLRELHWRAAFDPDSAAIPALLPPALDRLEIALLRQETASELASSGRIADLRCVHITHSMLEADSARSLLDATGSELRCLTLASSRVSPDAAVAAAALSVEALSLADNALGGATLELSPTVRRLHLQHIEAGVVDRLRGTGQLVELDLARSELGDAGLERFVERCDLSSLRRLTLGDNDLTARSIDALAAAGVLEHLVELDLATNPAGDDAAVALARASTPALELLELRSTRITDRGVAALAASDNSLRYLSLEDTGVGASGLRPLAASAAMTSLRWLHADLAHLPGKLRDALEARFQTAPFYLDNSLGCSIRCRPRSR